MQYYGQLFPGHRGSFCTESKRFSILMTSPMIRIYVHMLKIIIDGLLSFAW